MSGKTGLEVQALRLRANLHGLPISEPTLTREQCEGREVPHNNRVRFTTGFLCEDCGAWVAKDAPEYEESEGRVNALMAEQNRTAAYLQAHPEHPYYAWLRSGERWTEGGQYLGWEQPAGPCPEIKPDEQ